MGACGSLVFMIGVFLHSECHTEEVLDPRSGGPAEKEATTHGTWGVHLSVSCLFTFSYCSGGSQGKNTEVVYHSFR